MYYGRPSKPHFGTEVALQAYLDTGFRVAFGLVSRDQNIYVHEPNDDFLARLPTQLAREIAGSPMGYAWPIESVMDTYDHLVRDWDGRGGTVRTILAPDWTPACSDELYRMCRARADRDGTGITSHVLETRSEMLWNNHTYGKPALRRLADLGVLGPDVVCAHFVWVSDEELSIFADSGAVASNNAGSNLRLSSGICRTRDILASGGRIAFGTDGISFTDTDDMFTELRLATYLQRDPRTFGEVRLDSETVLRAAGENGARAVRQEGRIGALNPGMYADLLVLDTSRLLFPPGRFDTTPILDVLIDRAQAADLRTVMIHGRVVMAEGKVTAVDEEALRAEVSDSVARRVFDATEDVTEGLRLAAAVEPAVIDYFTPGYATPVVPASIYNARRQGTRT
jgi:5-methylthioadenosine/S-adenosylhomocysteine deaminase